MQITRNTSETATGPPEWFTGAVYVDTVAAPAGPSGLSAESDRCGCDALTRGLSGYRLGPRSIRSPRLVVSITKERELTHAGSCALRPA
jgi:hypothetical protein